MADTKLKSFKKIKTVTKPACITIRKAASLAGRKPRQIHGDCDRGTLNWGFLLDNTDEPIIGKEPDPEDHGQRVVIVDKVWGDYLLKKKQSDNR